MPGHGGIMTQHTHEIQAAEDEVIHRPYQQNQSPLTDRTHPEEAFEYGDSSAHPLRIHAFGPCHATPVAPNYLVPKQPLKPRANISTKPLQVPCPSENDQPPRTSFVPIITPIPLPYSARSKAVMHSMISPAVGGTSPPCRSNHSDLTARI